MMYLYYCSRNMQLTRTVKVAGFSVQFFAAIGVGITIGYLIWGRKKKSLVDRLTGSTFDAKKNRKIAIVDREDSLAKRLKKL